MHPEILTNEQTELLPLICQFSKEYYLVGGTAIALQIGHRRSIDFDLFTIRNIKRRTIKRIIEESKFPSSNVIYEDSEQLHILNNSVKITFFRFQFEIDKSIDFNNIIRMPELLTLSAMKAYALGGRAKWKDYVDLYYLLKNHFSLQQISNKAKELFKGFFNEKLFREQLSFYKDIDYSEKIEFIGEPIPEDEIKTFLTEIALTPF